jgi:hypothetical protein
MKAQKKLFMMKDNRLAEFNLITYFHLDMIFTKRFLATISSLLDFSDIKRKPKYFRDEF